MKQDDYIAGPHHYWTHFSCGMLFGAALGAWSGWWLFDGGWPLIITVLVTAIGVACSCGHWGDRAWRWILERLRWFA